LRRGAASGVNEAMELGLGLIDIRCSVGDYRPPVTDRLMH